MYTARALAHTQYIRVYTVRVSMCVYVYVYLFVSSIRIYICSLHCETKHYTTGFHPIAMHSYKAKHNHFMRRIIISVNLFSSFRSVCYLCVWLDHVGLFLLCFSVFHFLVSKYILESVEDLLYSNGEHPVQIQT